MNKNLKLDIVKLGFIREQKSKSILDEISDEKLLEKREPDSFSLVLSSEKPNLRIGEYSSISINTSPFISSAPILIWENNNPEVLALKDGKIFGLSEGEALIKATDVNSGISAELVIPVTASDEEVQPDDEIWYTTTDGNIIEFGSPNCFTDLEGYPVQILSNTYSEGKGIIKFENTPMVTSAAFYNASTLLTISLPIDFKYIGDATFKDCINLNNIFIPDSVTNIGNEGVFCQCTSLTEIILPQNLVEIGHSNTFSLCPIVSLTIPISVTKIGASAFAYCETLTSLICLSVVPPIVGEYLLNKSNNCIIYVPSQSVNVYKTATNWSQYADRIQAIPE